MGDRSHSHIDPALLRGCLRIVPITGPQLVRRPARFSHHGRFYPGPQSSMDDDRERDGESIV